MRLKISEAERRQAEQDIRSSEDIIIELLRNSRDAGAQNIYIALSKTDDLRSILILDDGAGIPSSHFEEIFEPRVTSKLDTSHMDKWGIHGRGMALYSISTHAISAKVACSTPEKGTSISIETSLKTLPEKTDQSTFPHFEVTHDGAYSMRGPKNILRVAAEFALEHRKDCNVYCGSHAEILATLYKHSMRVTTPAQRAFGTENDAPSIIYKTAFAADANQLASFANELGINLSARTCRRILDNEIDSLPSLLERIHDESMPRQKKSERRMDALLRDHRSIQLDNEDIELLSNAITDALSTIAEKHYMEPQIKPEIKVGSGKISITIPVQLQH